MSVKEVFLIALSAGVEVCDVIKNSVAEILKLQLLEDLGPTWPFGVNIDSVVVCCHRVALSYITELYVQVTVHRDNLRINKQQDASNIQNFILSRNSTCFGHLLCPSSGVISCKRGSWYVSCRLFGGCLGESGFPT